MFEILEHFPYMTVSLHCWVHRGKSSLIISDFVTCASCIFCAFFSGMQSFLFQRVPGCSSIADLSLKIVFCTHKFAVVLIDMGNRESHKPKIVNESLNNMPSQIIY